MQVLQEQKPVPEPPLAPVLLIAYMDVGKGRELGAEALARRAISSLRQRDIHGRTSVAEHTEARERP